MAQVSSLSLFHKMEGLNPDLFIEFISLSGEVIHKTSNLEELRSLYYSWTTVFKVKTVHTYDYNDLEEPNVFNSDTRFFFNDIGFTTFPDLMYHILTKSTIGANNIVTVIKSPEMTYECMYLYESNSLNFGFHAYLRRIR